MFSVSDTNDEEEEEDGRKDGRTDGRRGCCEIRLNSAEPEEEEMGGKTFSHKQL